VSKIKRKCRKKLDQEERVGRSCLRLRRKSKKQIMLYLKINIRVKTVNPSIRV
jgi:hypothetical protein